MQFFLISCIISNFVYAQSAEKYILNYNKIIDSFNKLDSIKSIKFKMRSNAIWNLNSFTKEVQSERNCIYYSNGKTICKYQNSLGQEIDEEFAVPDDEGGNAVKVFLNIIYVSDNFKFDFLINNDSIVVIEQIKHSSFAKHQYTFDKRTSTLKHIKRITSKNESVSEAVTSYINFQIIDGLRIPLKASYKNNFGSSLVEYLEIRIEYQ
jgi:hypothetical protein